MTDLLASWNTDTSAVVSKDEALQSALDGCDRLRTALEQQDPQMGSYLNLINKQLRQFPELVHLLPDDQISVIVQAHLQKKLAYLDEKSKPKARKSKTSAALPDGGMLADLL